MGDMNLRNGGRRSDVVRGAWIGVRGRWAAKGRPSLPKDWEGEIDSGRVPAATITWRNAPSPLDA